MPFAPMAAIGLLASLLLGAHALHAEPGGRILDPFAGAGTTVLAAVQEGYEAVGIEMSDAYFQRSTERLKTALESEVNQN